MLLILLIVALSALRFFEIGLFAELSWWWIGGLFLLTFIWFEYIEKMLGLDKKKALQQFDKARQERIKKTFEKKK